MQIGLHKVATGQATGINTRHTHTHVGARKVGNTGEEIPIRYIRYNGRRQVAEDCVETINLQDEEKEEAMDENSEIGTGIMLPNS
jgi:hypothetical protein